MAGWLKYYDANTNEIDTLIDDGKSLEDILDNNEVLTEFKMQNAKLITFISQPENLKKLIGYLTYDTKPSDSNKVKYAYPYLASEILSESDEKIIDAIINSDALDMLFEFIERDRPIQHLYAHHVCRLFHALLTQRGQKLIEKFDSKGTVLKLINQLDGFPFCELLFDLICIVEVQHGKEGLTEWMAQYDLVYRLLKALKESPNPLTAPNTAQIINNIIVRYSDTPENQKILFEKIFGEKETKLLLDLSMFGYRSAEETPVDECVSMSACTSAASLLVDMTWNNRYIPPIPAPMVQNNLQSDPNDPNAMNDQNQNMDNPDMANQFDPNQPPPHPLDTDALPPLYIQKNILLNLPKFVACLDFDWTVYHDRVSRAVNKAKSVLKKKAEREANATSSENSAPVSKETLDEEAKAEELMKRIPPFGFASYPVPSHYRAGRKSVGTYRMKLIILISTIIRTGYGFDIDNAFLDRHALIESIKGQVNRIEADKRKAEGATEATDDSSISPESQALLKFLDEEDSKIVKNQESLFKPIVKIFTSYTENSLVHCEIFTLFETVMMYRSKNLQIDLMSNAGLAQYIWDSLKKEKARRVSVANWREEREAQRKKEEEEAANEEPSFVKRQELPDLYDSTSEKGPKFPPNDRPEPAVCNLAHVLHLGRIMEQSKLEIEELRNILEGQGEEANADGNDWNTLYEDIINPEMQSQQQQPEFIPFNDSLNYYGNNDFSDEGMNGYPGQNYDLPIDENGIGINNYGQNPYNYNEHPEDQDMSPFDNPNYQGPPDVSD